MVVEGQGNVVFVANQTLNALQVQIGLLVQLIAVLGDEGWELNALVAENEVPILTVGTGSPIQGVQTIIDVYFDTCVVGDEVGFLAYLAAKLLTFVLQTIGDHVYGLAYVFDDEVLVVSVATDTSIGLEGIVLVAVRDFVVREANVRF